MRLWFNKEVELIYNYEDYRLYTLLKDRDLDTATLEFYMDDDFIIVDCRDIEEILFFKEYMIFTFTDKTRKIFEYGDCKYYELHYYED